MLTYVASDALGSTKRCSRLTNYVYPQTYKKGFIERRS